MGSQPVNADLAAELWNELAEARTSFPPEKELIAKGELHINKDRAKFMRSRIAPLVRRLRGDEARAALGEARQFAALGECFVYLHWVSQATGSPSAAFRDYADHYLTSAISLLEDRANDGPRGAARGRAQSRKVSVESLQFFLNAGLDMPVHYVLTAPPTLPEVPSTSAGEAGGKVIAPPVGQPGAAQNSHYVLTAPPTLPEVPSTSAGEAGGKVIAPPVGQPGAAQNSHVDIKRVPAAPAPETLFSTPKMSGSELTLIAFAFITLLITVMAGAVVAVAVLTAARMRVLLSEWPEKDWGIVLSIAIVGGLIGFIFMLPGATRPNGRFRKLVLWSWPFSVLVSIIGVACVGDSPDAMKLVDSNVTGLAALMSERFGRMMSEGSASILSATIICTIVGVVLGAAIGFAFRLLLPFLFLLPEQFREGPRGPAR